MCKCSVRLMTGRTTSNIIQAFHPVEEMQVMYKGLRDTADRNFSKIFDYSVTVSDKVHVPLAELRTAEQIYAPC